MSPDRLLALYSWYKDWATTAKSVISKKQHLIAVGLAAPRRPSEAGADLGQAPPPEHQHAWNMASPAESASRTSKRRLANPRTDTNQGSGKRLGFGP